MTSPLVKFLRKVFGVPERVHTEIDPESVRKHNLVRALANENAELKGIIAKKKTEEGKRRERLEDKNEEEEVIWELDKQKKEIQKKTYPKYFSLKTFFNRLNRDKILRSKLGFYDFKRSTKLAKFGDIGFSSDGKIVLMDEKGIVLMNGYSLKNIFQSVSGLGNDVTTNKIPLNVNEKGEFVENIMEYEMPTIYQTPEGKFQYTTAKKRPLYEFVQELQEEIQDKDSKIEELENTLTLYSKKTTEHKVAEQVAIDISETDRSNLSEVTKEASSIGRIFRQTSKELSQLRDSNTILNESVDKLERQLEKMMKEAERQGVKMGFDDAMEKIDMIKSTLREKTMIPPQSNQQNITKSMEKQL